MRRRFWQRAHDHGVELTVGAEGGLRLAADPMRLEQALGNLVDNALRHGSGRVRLGARSAGDAVELHVLDGGPGFPPGFVDRAFQRVSRGDEARGRGGSGLGLAIVRAVAEAHGGTVALEPPPNGRGARFVVRLPALPGTAGELDDVDRDRPGVVA